LLAQAGAADQDRPVVLWLPNGASVIAAMLATLKAGGFYVVIDPRYPVERNSAILNNSEAEWVITDTAHRSAVEAHFPGNRILMSNKEAKAGLQLNTSSLDPSSRRAAMVYTSGSTGQPKGVLHSHAFILGWTQLYVSDLHISSSDRVSLLYSASVAGAIRDIYGALLTGAMLLPFNVREHSFGELARYLVDGRVTIYHSVATLFRQLIMSRSAVTSFPDVRALVFGGERVLARDLSLIRECFTASTMVYTSIGSTEAGTFARLFLHPDSDHRYAAIPLGFAPAGCRVMLMDDHNMPVADGESGEIVVESRYLADQYWRNPQETARAFSAVPHDPSLRRYHTGDLGMPDADRQTSTPQDLPGIEPLLYHHNPICMLSVRFVIILTEDLTLNCIRRSTNLSTNRLYEYIFLIRHEKCITSWCQRRTNTVFLISRRDHNEEVSSAGCCVCSIADCHSIQRCPCHYRSGRIPGKFW